MDWTLFWTAVGAIGTSLGSIATALAVWVSLKPYRKQLSVVFSAAGYEDRTEYTIQFHNTGHSIYVSSIGLYYQSRIIVDCPLIQPILIPANKSYAYVFSDEDVKTMQYHIRKSQIDCFDVHIYDVHGKCLKKKMDVSWYKMLLNGRQAIISTG